MEDVQANKEVPLTSIQLDFTNTRTDAKTLSHFLQKVKEARTVGELHEKVVNSAYKLSRLGMYAKCDIVVNAGEGERSAQVIYDLKDWRWWGGELTLVRNREGGANSLAFLLRNLRGCADETRVFLDYKPNTGTYGYGLKHKNPLFDPNKLSSTFKIKSQTELLDQNITEDAYGGQFSVETIDAVNKLTVGRYTRTNLLTMSTISPQLLQSELLVSAKNFVRHRWQLDTREGDQYYERGHLLRIYNEIAFGNDVRFHKAEARAEVWRGLPYNLALQGNLGLGFIVPWGFTQTRLTDRFSGQYLKGFRNLGSREGVSDKLGSFGIPGDNLGENSILQAEAKLHFYNVGVLKELGLVPFVYANAAVPGVFASMDLAKRLRYSAGFGLGWNTALGRIEFAFSGLLSGRPSDALSSFLVLVTQ